MSGDVQELVRLLAEDVVSISDGAGKPPATPHPIHTRERVSRGLIGGLHKMPPDRVWIEEANGQPAIVATLNGKPYGVVLLA